MFLTVAIALMAGSAEPTVAAAQRPVPPARVTDLGGLVGRRSAANREGYLAHFDIDAHTRMVEQPRQRDWWWIGEQPGKWLESAVLAAQTGADAALLSRAKAICARLVAAQAPDGYLGITDPALRSAAQPLRGMDAYELYFTLHGLLTAAEQLPSAEALTAARRLGDYFERTIGPGRAEFWPSDARPPENVGKKLDGHSAIAGHSVHYGWEGSLLIDPMMRLYEVTGERRYLDWCRWVVSRLDVWSGHDAFGRLDQVADGTLGMHQLQPYVHSHTFQMNFLGLLRLYQATGDASLLRKVRGAWDDVAGRQMYITGGVSVGEHYERDYLRPLTGNVVETCASMSWMQLTEYLLELTGDPRYADAIERLLWNHVFASQTVDGDCYRYHTPPNGGKPEHYFHGPDCCTASGHRLVSMLPGYLYAERGERNLVVNQYVPSTVKTSLATVVVSGSYPEGDTISLAVTPAEPRAFTLSLRLPGWCAQPRLTVNGKAVEGLRPGAYADLTRTWQPGDVVTLTLPMAVGWVRHDHLDPAEAPWTLQRGPVVFAADTVWWDDPAPMPGEIGVQAGVLRDEPKLEATPPGLLGPTYRTGLKLLDGRQVTARWVPFANMGVWYRPGQPKPERGSRAFSYALWLPAADSAGFQALIDRQRRLEALRAQSVDYVEIGDAQSERAHGLAAQGSNTGPFRDRVYRHAAGGWFSYQLKPGDQPVALVVTYWGGETGNRVFEVSVDGQVVATQKLAMDRPGEFFEVRHALPLAMTRGKAQVTVKFTAQPGATAGGVFGLRLEKAEKP